MSDLLPLSRKGLPPVECLLQYPLPLEVVQELFGGNKIRAIKAYRTAYTRKFPLKRNDQEDQVVLLGLREAKEAVDWFIEHIGPYVCTFDICGNCNGVGVHQQQKIEAMNRSLRDAQQRERERQRRYDDDAEDEVAHDVPF